MFQKLDVRSVRSVHAIRKKNRQWQSEAKRTHNDKVPVDTEGNRRVVTVRPNQFLEEKQRPQKNSFSN